MSGGRFAIDAATGGVVVNRSLDFETAFNYTLTVEVWDNGIAGSSCA